MKIRGEILDLLAGAAFPFMLMLILSATVIGFISYGGKEDIALKAVILVAGELLLVAATVIFGKQNAASAYKKSIQNGTKREAGSQELKVVLRVCVPFIIINIIYSAAPNKACEFIMFYMFGWAYYPFGLMNLSPWLNFIWVIPYVAVHAGAYVYGGKTERKKQEIMANQNEITAKRGKK